MTSLALATVSEAVFEISAFGVLVQVIVTVKVGVAVIVDVTVRDAVKV